jgi:hypothetical protein
MLPPAGNEDAGVGQDHSRLGASSPLQCVTCPASPAINDLHPHLRGFEYDVKRLAASFTIAARNNGFSEAAAREVTMTCVAAYREAMAGFASMRMLDIWYARLAEDELLTAMRQAARRVAKARAARQAAKGKKAAFSPTDVSAIKRWAKLLMITEAVVSLGIGALVIARAINILK